jgi:hypothetical protein
MKLLSFNRPRASASRFFSVLSALLSPFVAAIQASATTNVFPLMAWDYVDDAKTFEAMRDCGITSVAFVRPDMLDTCKKYRLQAIVFDEAIAGRNWAKAFYGNQARSNIAAIVKKTRNHPAVMGYHLKDEPGAGEYAELAKAVAAIKEIAPDKWSYINLLPGSGESYDKYIEDFISICRPTALSYDRYSLVKEGEIHAGFWENLAQMRMHAVQHELPFWNIVLSSPHWGYRDMTEADVRIQDWGSLAYGVRGIAYYKFCSRELAILDAADLGNFRGGPLDQFGEKTSAWLWLRNVNRQIQNLAPVYLNLHSDDVYHMGNIPERNHGPTETNLVKSMPKGDFVIGDFTHSVGTRYAIIVNKSLKSSAQVLPEFNNAYRSVKYVSPITGQAKKFPSPYYWLAPGQGVLLRLEK